MSKKKGNGIAKWSILTAVTCALLIASIIGTQYAMSYQSVINIFLGTSNYKIVETGDAGEKVTNYVSDYNSTEELFDAGAKLGALIEEEGAVLLKNDNTALPLQKNAKVSLFSNSSVDIVYGGTGSASFDTDEAVNLKTALTNAGFEINQALWDFYETGAGSTYVREVPDWSGTYEYYKTNEVPWNIYTDEVKNSFAEYGDAAIVVLSRVGGEDMDLTLVESSEENYLELTAEEVELFTQLNNLKQQGVFRSIVVLINSSNAPEVDFLFDETYGVDACLVIGGVGMTGLDGVAAVLNGEANPSGSLVDTYCLDNTTSPAYQSLGDTIYFTNADFSSGEYHYNNEDYTMYGNIIYQEGIYIGYAYYETRYEDTVMGTGNTQGYVYGNDVAYPFGYGLSYTDFEWSNYQVTENADSFTVSVTVTNVGDTAGKDVVQVYFQSPYTDYDKENGIEKAAVELCGFAKTSELAPNESETVTIEVEKEEFKAYDANNAKTYILDAGDYYITAAEHAHAAVNNILAAKGYTMADGMDAEGDMAFVTTWTNESLDTKTYSVSSATGYEITNQFENADINNSELIDYSVTYLTRSDWTGTFPTPNYVECSEELYAYLNRYATDLTDSSDTTELPVMGADNGLVLANYIGVAYDDPSWEDLLDQLTFEEMANVIGVAYHNTAAIESVSKPATADENGPQGLTAKLTMGDSYMAYPSGDVQAATWNVDLIKELGNLIGEDCLNAGYSGLYGPGLNIHRSPYCGRNFEYYSECAFLTGKIATASVDGLNEKGVYAYLKHFALNDQETQRNGICTWANEQTIRELYLKAFELPITDKNEETTVVDCVMSAFNCIGDVWAGAHYGLMTEVLRNEWGMEGIALTDYGDMKYMSAKLGVLAGSSAWDSSSDMKPNELNLYKNEGAVVQAMREATHHILYTTLNSNAMNGMSANTKFVAITPWWKMACYVLEAVLGILSVLCAVKLVLTIKKAKTVKEE